MSLRLSLVGPTAAGKTALAMTLAEVFEGVELISADALAVYRGLDIGTAKPTTDEQRRARWHLIDIVEAAEEFSVAAFQGVAFDAIAGVEGRGNDVVLVGGTGLYHRAVIDELHIPRRFPDIAGELEAQSATLAGLALLYDELVRTDATAARRIEPTNRRRVIRALEVTRGERRPFSSFGTGLSNYGASRFFLVGLRFDRDELDCRIARRLELQFELGFIEEVRALVRAGVELSRTAAQAIGYRELAAYVAGSCSLDDARTEILRRTRAFARRQIAWFRRDPRICWIDGASSDVTGQLIGLFGARREAIAMGE